MKLSIAAGSTNETIDLFLQDSSQTNGAGLTGLVFNTASLTCYYNFPRQASTVVNLATLASPTAAWSSGGFKEIDSVNQPGHYRFDIPNALLASGNGRYVKIVFRGATNLADYPIELELVGWNNQLVPGTNGAMPTCDASNGVKLAVAGFANISTSDPGSVAGQTTIDKMIVALWRRFIGAKVVKDLNNHTITVYSVDGTTPDWVQGYTTTITQNIVNQGV